MAAMHLPAKQKLAAYAAGVALLGGVSFVGARQLRPDAPLSVAPISGTVPPRAPQGEGKPAEIETPTPGVAPEPAPKEVVVAMAGAVKTPGLLHLPLGSRIDDAIKRAGGAKADADLEAINLAAKAIDGDQIYVPAKKKDEGVKAVETTKVGERYRGGTIANDYASRPLEPMPPALGGHVGKASDGHSGAKAKASGPVSLNTASEAQLESLPGVGPSTAQKILDYRQEHGGFGTVEEIQSVKGIGPKKFDKMKPFLKL